MPGLPEGVNAYSTAWHSHCHAYCASAPSSALESPDLVGAELQRLLLVPTRGADRTVISFASTSRTRQPGRFRLGFQKLDHHQEGAVHGCRDPKLRGGTNDIPVEVVDLASLPARDILRG